MKLQRTVLLIVGMIGIAAGACTKPPTGSGDLVSDRASASDSSSDPSSDPSIVALPLTKTASVAIDGTLSTIELQLFEQNSLPFVTYYPSQDFTPESNLSTDVAEMRFVSHDSASSGNSAYVLVVVPPDAADLDAIRERVLGEDGLFATNRWEMLDRTEVVSYPWAIEKIVYQQDGQGEPMTGAIFIGEEAGKAFYVLTQYPQRDSDRLEPKAALILENISFEQ